MLSITLMLFQFRSIRVWSSSRTCFIVMSISVMLGGSAGYGFGCDALVMPSQPKPMGCPLLSRDA